MSVNNTLVCSNSTNVLNMFLVSKTNVRKAVRKVGINTVCGPDNNPAFFVVDCISRLDVPLCNIFNLIVKSVRNHQVWKVSRVVPVYKTALKMGIALMFNSQNYINLLCLK